MNLTREQVQGLAQLRKRAPDHFMDRFMVRPKWWHQWSVGIAHQLGLTASEPRKIWDLGGGIPYFGKVCLDHGHDVTSLDIDDDYMRECHSILEVPYHVHRMSTSNPLPDVCYDCDVITMFGVNLTEKKTNRFYSKHEWLVVINDVMSRLKPDGVFHLRPNFGEETDFLLGMRDWPKEDMPLVDSIIYTGGNILELYHDND